MQLSTQSKITAATTYEVIAAVMVYWYIIPEIFRMLTQQLDTKDLLLLNGY